MMGTGVLAFVGKKNMSKVVGISKHFTQFCISIIVFLFLFKTAYVYSARRGYLGELSRIKIEHQTRGKNGTFALLMGGRPEFFSGVYVALKKPILGFGPWAFDTEGYEEEFYEKYATQSAYEDFLRGTSLMKESGYTRIVSGHSHLIGFWSWYGIFGLFFWIYVLWQLYMLWVLEYSFQSIQPANADSGIDYGCSSYEQRRAQKEIGDGGWLWGKRGHLCPTWEKA